jgi:hypothetical protein
MLTFRAAGLGAIVLFLFAGLEGLLDNSATAQQAFDVRRSGAKCDGVTDDTAAFAAAIAAAGALNGGVVAIPPSKQPCQITQLSIDASYLTLEGAGMTDDNVNAVGPSRIRCTAASGACIRIGSRGEVSNLVLRDLDIIGNPSLDHGLRFTGTASGRACVRCRIERVAVHGFTKTGAIGIYHDNGVTNTFRNVYVYGNYDGMRIESDLSTTLHLSGLIARVNRRYGLVIQDGPQQIVLDGASVIETNGDAGIFVNMAASRSYGIILRDAFVGSNNAASGNRQMVFQGAGGYDSRNVLLTGLYFSQSAAGATSTDIDLGGVHDVVVANVVGGAGPGGTIVKLQPTATEVQIYAVQSSAGGAVDPDSRAMMTLSYDGTLRLGAWTFSRLGAAPNGAIRFCADCTLANPCGPGGTGAIAKRLSDAWNCN